ncbi:hypothetical protein OTERR_18620 [Oryzomicrobium terrae]|uniref:DUF4136 domain-containing protein n=1 Tax=Oryzomicrobium terrae TaxID=1735038 RepID=A0A5C1EAM9_9RHOO|nr:DUF4136 domain-containing protein [Oryzomicrobium terrae]QEL65338.1 hypothetical protein OTERR_18620 [Oryzomicrobium terrae]
MVLPSRLFVLCLSLLLAACASEPRVRSDYDPQADFSRYQTFAFFSPAGTDKAGYGTLVTERLKHATRAELERRGYVYREASPDLLVNFSGKLEHRTSVVPAPPPPPMGYYGYRGGFYGPWPGYGWGQEVINYTEGTLNIDLVDARRRQLVWEGVGVGTVGDVEEAISQKSLDKAVAAIFARYPFVAGVRATAPAKDK